MKEYRIERVIDESVEDDERTEIFVHVGCVYTDWVAVAVEFTRLQREHPTERFFISSRKVTEWEECYR